MKDYINDLLNKCFSYKSPILYFCIIIIVGLITLQDKLATGEFLGTNGLMLSFNMVLYFSLLHIVYKFSVKQKPTVKAETFQRLAEQKQIKVEIHPPIVKKGYKEPEDLEKIYLTAMSFIIVLFLVYVVHFYSKYRYLNPIEKRQLQIGFVLIVLTVYSELFLVFHVFDNEIVPQCEVLLKSITNPIFEFKEKKL